jgi:hypothetical protein
MYAGRSAGNPEETTMLITKASKAMRFDLALLHIDPESIVLVRPSLCNATYQVCVLASDGVASEPVATIQPETYQQMLSWHAERL